MSRIIKVISIVVICITSLYLLWVFTLLNFPYQSAILRLGNLLRERYDMSLLVGTITYRYPLKLYLEDVRVLYGKGSLMLKFDDVFLRLRLLPFSRLCSIELSGDGVGVKSEYVNLSGAFMNLESEVRIGPLIRGKEGNHVDSLQFLMGGADIERVMLSGFEFSSVHLKQSLIDLRSDGNSFVVEKGAVNTNVMRSEITGRVDFEELDLTVLIALTDEFYRKYPQMKGIVDSVFSSGTLRLSIAGSAKNPIIRKVSR